MFTVLLPRSCRHRLSRSGFKVRTVADVWNVIGKRIGRLREGRPGIDSWLSSARAQLGAIGARLTSKLIGKTGSRRTYTILVVEDSDVVRHLAHRILVRQGYRVLDAADAHEALAVLATRTKLDLALVDVVLPNTDGIELYATMSARRPKLPVLFMSAYPAEILAARGLPDLTLPFLAKPFSPDTLLAKVKATIEPRRSPSKKARPSPHTPGSRSR